jgi:hypothetical protein
MRVVNFEIHLIPNRNFFCLQVFLRLYYTSDTTIFVFTHLDFAHSFSKYGAWNETKQNIDSVFGVSVHPHIHSAKPNVAAPMELMKCRLILDLTNSKAYDEYCCYLNPHLSFAMKFPSFVSKKKPAFTPLNQLPRSRLYCSS